jgi:hypothetical protein
MSIWGSVCSSDNYIDRLPPTFPRSHTLAANSQRTDTRRRFRATLRWMAGLVLVSIAGSWLFLYLDSVYQRRRAESLFAELKSLDFSTAGFAAVRDIAVRYGGHGTQPELRPRFPDFGDPMVDDHGNVSFPWRPQPWPMCTPQNCTFRLWIMTRWPRIPLVEDRTAEFFYTTLPYIGVRSWVVYAQFDVRNGKLDRSDTGVEEYRMERVNYSAYRQFVPRGYDVATRRDAASFEYGPCSSQDYQYRRADHQAQTFLLVPAGVWTKSRRRTSRDGRLANPGARCALRPRHHLLGHGHDVRMSGCPEAVGL